ncbi:hypothetical protein RFI_01924, partial [Reticulomyxa filosa]
MTRKRGKQNKANNKKQFAKATCFSITKKKLFQKILSRLSNKASINAEGSKNRPAIRITANSNHSKTIANGLSLLCLMTLYMSRTIESFCHPSNTLNNFTSKKKKVKILLTYFFLNNINRRLFSKNYVGLTHLYVGDDPVSNFYKKRGVCEKNENEYTKQKQQRQYFIRQMEDLETGHSLQHQPTMIEMPKSMLDKIQDTIEAEEEEDDDDGMTTATEATETELKSDDDFDITSVGKHIYMYINIIYVHVICVCTFINVQNVCTRFLQYMCQHIIIIWSNDIEENNQGGTRNYHIVDSKLNTNIRRNKPRSHTDATPEQMKGRIFGANIIPTSSTMLSEEYVDNHRLLVDEEEEDLNTANLPPLDLTPAKSLPTESIQADVTSKEIP